MKQKFYALNKNLKSNIGVCQENKSLFIRKKMAGASTEWAVEISLAQKTTIS